jgi:site-specific DNA recombinase
VMQLDTENAEQVKRAVYLLRVSDPKQMHTATDIDPEGNSIPTQRSCCDVKAKELGVIKVDEYIEPGYSGLSMDKRPVFKELLKRIVEQRDVDYVIIYMRSRIFRNYVEAAVVKQQLDKLGVKLISAKENFGEGYMAEAMEAVTDVFNWVQVRMNGEDIKTKMLNKAQNGGTNGRAKLGYQNTTVTIDGHKVNTIALDDERAPYVRMAFELWATGRYPNIQQLCDKLTDAGLRMPTTGKPVSVQTLWKILRDRYYVGYVTYKGVEYPGRHTPLISEDLFDRAQRILDSHSGSGTRQRTHHHYLKGVVWCARCKQRFIVQRSKGRHGGIYYYFFCGGREDKT